MVNWYLVGPQATRPNSKAAALEDNVTRWVLEHAKVVDTPVAFDELMGHNQR